MNDIDWKPYRPRCDVVQEKVWAYYDSIGVMESLVLGQKGYYYLYRVGNRISRYLSELLPKPKINNGH